MGKSPDAFRTISEVADWLDTQAHVLRFWESKFTQVKPVKRAGGRRYYRPADMLLLGGIKTLLHDEGMTIKGAQKLLRDKGIKYVSSLSQPIDGEDEDNAAQDDDIGLIEVPLMEEERGTVLAFERPEEDTPEEAPTAEAPTAPEALAESEDTTEITEAPQDIEDDLFSTSETATDEETDSPPQDEIPSFVQRVTPKPAETEDTQEPDSCESETPDHSTASEPQTPVLEESATQNDKTTDEPGQSLLPDIATMTGIAPEHRAEATALLDRLAALTARIEAVEKA